MPRLLAADGQALIEVMVAILVLMVGLVGLLTGFATASKLSLISQRQATMSHIAEREIERIEAISYPEIGLSSTPSTSADHNNPDHYVSGGTTPTFEWDRTGNSSETLDIDTTNGTVAPVQSWSEGDLSGSIYDFVTWTADTACGEGCPTSDDYKRITVAVTAPGHASPSPVYVSSVIVNPDAAPTDGTSNGTTGNPVSNGGTTCANVTGTSTTQGPCESPIDSGTPNTFFLHDCAATASSCATTPVASTLHDTVGALGGLLACSVSTVLGLLTGDDNGCPTPDEMDSNPPSGTSTTPLYSYSTDVGATGYVGGRLLEPLCGTGSICGTGSTTNCNSAVSWVSSLINTENELWVTAPVSTATTLTGEGALNLFTESQNGTDAIVTLCVELYEIPPSDGIVGSLANILAWPPTALGGAGYVAATDPATDSNWPTSPTNVDYEFNFASGGVTVPAGDRIGLRVWMVANVNAAIALIYDNPDYPSELQLNSQSAITLSGS
jgi:hypothetical protein